ncbi:adenylate kinase 9 isoform X2 [Denticeps clupeoides]|uniref:adenylate kinase 9 isoform X2 n=1 Tax=Denticeps clupeoides TaxID=299321 RepID=UPI0010A49090|nr:adenylate kinase 9 isoform X2 [Denticeps clupeoides]
MTPTTDHGDDQLGLNEDEAERRLLRDKPSCFIVLGKPGVGRSTLAKKLAESWKCVFVDDTELLNYHINNVTEQGLELLEILREGNPVPEQKVFQLILEKLHSPDVQHYGYVLSCLPSMSEQHLKVQEQVDLIRNLPLPPDFIINIKCEDQDLVQRLGDLRQHPATGRVFGKEQWDSVGREAKQRRHDLEEEDEEEDQIDESETMEEAELQKDMITQLVQVRENCPVGAHQKMLLFKDTILGPLEDYMADHHHMYLFEVDGNKDPEDLLGNVLSRLESMAVNRVPVPVRLLQAEEDELPDEIDTDKLLPILASCKMVASGCRWRRSRWGRVCPVALKEGKIVMGKPEFSLGFLDKMYVLSSHDALQRFMQNPRQYLLPPMPRPPCKVCVIGPPCSGKTTLSHLLAEHYGAALLNVEKLMQPLVAEVTLKHLERLRQETTLVAIEKVKLKVEQESVNAAETEVTVEHPEVQTLVMEAMKEVEHTTVPLPPETYLQELHKYIKELEVEDANSELKRGWVLDNFPQNAEQLHQTLTELIPDMLICLRDSETAGSTILTRLYESNKEEVDLAIRRRQVEERKQAQDDTLVPASHDDPTPADELPRLESIPEESKGVSLSSQGYPDCPEMSAYVGQVKQFEQNWQGMKPYLTYPYIQMEISGRSPDDLLQEACLQMERPFQYMAQELSGEDEEEEDAQAMNEEEEEEPQGEEEELEESVPQHTLGDTLHYCPVVLKERASLVPCRDEHPARYRERVHYCSSPETLQRFLSNPQYYVCHTHLLQPPALRLFLLGVRSSGKTNHGKWLAERLGLFHIQFRECLQELLLKKTQQRVQYRDLTEPPSDSPDQLQDLLRELEGPNGLEESNNSNTHSGPTQEASLTDEEEAIKAYLMDGEPLPQEVLEMVLPQWWEQEPFRSTGFILEGFPQNQEEVQFMVERYLYPDAAVVMTLDVGDIMGRTLPFHLQRWRERHDRRKDTQLRVKELRCKVRAEAIANRRAELIEEHKVKEDSDGEQNSDGDPEDAENWQEEIEVLLEEEFPPEEEEEVGEDEETETSAEERLQDDIAARFETDSNNLNSVVAALRDHQVPQLPVNAGRMQRIVRYQLLEKVEPLLLHRKALFIKPQPISYSLAQRLLYHSYKYYSAFGRWDPVRLAEGDPLQPPQTPSYPAMLRQFIYFFSSRETRHTFMKNPIRYLQQTSPNPSLPIRLAIVGPPNSGKTTVAGMFASEYGLAHLSLSEVMQRVLNDQGQTELANQMRQQLSQGLSVPDELAVRCLEVVLMDLPCSTRGYVLDGFPVTQQQAKLMAVRSIVPVLIIEMQLDTVEVLKRGLKGGSSKGRTSPHLDSAAMCALRNSCHQREVDAVRSHFQQLHQNWVHVDAQRNKWSVWTQVLERVHVSMAQIHTYLQRIRKGQAAGIAHLCVTPKELQARLGEFGHYCPVSLALHHHLVDCSGRASFRLVAEYRKCYYRMASAEFLQKFLESPERFVLPACPHPLPPPHLLPRKLSEVQVKRHFPQQVEMKGYCPVTFGDGQLRYESLVKGSVEYAVEYREKIYVLEGEEKREKFLRQPHVYWDLKLPHKLPPLAEPVQLTSLPMLGYLEQGVAKAIIKAMTAVGCLKPKFPYLSAKRSALLYVAVYLKAFNPRLSQFTRHKFRCQLAQLEESCELISYLSSAMADTNSEPQEKSVVFQHKLHQFLASEKSFH